MSNVQYHSIDAISYAILPFVLWANPLGNLADLDRQQRQTLRDGADFDNKAITVKMCANSSCLVRRYFSILAYWHSVSSCDPWGQAQCCTPLRCLTTGSMTMNPLQYCTKYSSKMACLLAEHNSSIILNLHLWSQYWHFSHYLYAKSYPRLTSTGQPFTLGVSHQMRMPPCSPLSNIS